MAYQQFFGVRSVPPCKDCCGEQCTMNCSPSESEPNWRELYESQAAEYKIARERLMVLADACSAKNSALRPFVEAAADLDAAVPDRSHIWESPAAMSITAADLRAAVVAYTDK